MLTGPRRSPRDSVFFPSLAVVPYRLWLSAVPPGTFFVALGACPLPFLILQCS